MTQATNSMGVWDVRRKITLPSLNREEEGLVVSKTIEAIEGVRKATFDLQKQRLDVEYSAAETDYHTIVSALVACGFPPATTWLARLKGNWYQFTDTNSHENANLPPPACCSKPPRKR